MKSLSLFISIFFTLFVLKNVSAKTLKPPTDLIPQAKNEKPTPPSPRPLLVAYYFAVPPDVIQYKPIKSYRHSRRGKSVDSILSEGTTVSVDCQSESYEAIIHEISPHGHVLLEFHHNIDHTPCNKGEVQLGKISPLDSTATHSPQTYEVLSYEASP